MAPVTLTEGQLKQVAEKLERRGKAVSNKEQRKRTSAAHAEHKLDDTTREKLRQLCAKVERLEEEKKGLADDIKEVFAEAKALGFDTATMRAALRQRKIDEAERDEKQMMLDLYMEALGD
ncbi:MAG: DUF2312 domain-containing protein [Acidobacteria bacterium]|nr:DUF2312 domain-containing protein [Acidobacteriota bacterium]